MVLARSLALAGLLSAPCFAFAQTEATGIVFDDKNENGVFDQGESTLSGIRVSNGREIVRTDKKGRYRLPVGDDTILFVIKPSGWRTPVDELQVPRFYYIHKPAGSPKQHFPGVAPTGPLPESVDFPLYKQKEPDEFRAILFGDPQPRNMAEVEYITHDVIDDLVGVEASFGVTLGDILFDDLSLFRPMQQRIAMMGIPWYNVIGNHDLNHDSPDDKHSDETFEANYGPNYYSFEYGPVHFIAVDDVRWFVPKEPEIGKNGKPKGKYVGGLGKKQMAFIKNDLALIPEDQLVVLMMHIPLVEAEDRQELYRLIEKRPFCISISGHTHFQEHVFIDGKDGWQGSAPHHHIVNVTVSGSWWSGATDERGIPHTTMRCGAPNGYSIISFDGSSYTWDFQAARRPADYQMSIMAPNSVDSAETSGTLVSVNVFGGSERSTVEMRLDNQEGWTAMKKVRKPDPDYLALKELEASPKPPNGRKLPDVIKSPHLWESPLPANLPAGEYTIAVRTTDMFGRVYTAERVIIVK